jgi:endonuclease YncB( thermonuclease family)
MLNILFKVLFVLATAGIQLTIVAADSFGPYQGKVIKVEEGDTLYTEIEIWPGSFRRVYVRLKDIDTAEPSRLKGGRSVSACEKKAAKKAIKYVRKFIANAKSVTVSSVNQIKSTSNYVFARISVDGKDLGEALVKHKLAIAVTGLNRKRWSCRNS